MPQTFPIPPNTGPPPACPIAFDCPVSEITVARTLELVICWFSQVSQSGNAMLRAKKTPSRPAIATQTEPVRAKTSMAASCMSVKAKRNCAIVWRPPRSTRLIRLPIAAMLRAMPASQKMPNQTTGSSCPTAGNPTSRRKCASFSRSNASLEAPMNNSDPIRSTITGAAHA